ncbi:MAG: siphovirus Gp157 family protein [Myxococcales bacterium]|nr:siphovirus Gp157 family protein [Myxococcales bacterium]
MTLSKNALRGALYLHERELDYLDDWRGAPDDEMPEKVRRALAEAGRGECDELLRHLRAARDEARGREHTLKLRAEEIATARAEVKALQEWIDAQVVKLLSRHGVGKTHKLVIDGEEIALRRSKVVRIDERYPVDLIPHDLLRLTEPKLAADKKAIKAALEDGRPLPFAHLEERKNVKW